MGNLVYCAKSYIYSNQIGKRYRESRPCAFFLTEHHAMKAYWGSGGITPFLLWPWH